MTTKTIAAATIATILALGACRNEDIIIVPDVTDVQETEQTEVLGMYVLNEGNMGMNKCTLDYLDYSSGGYISNIYSSRNPDVPKELGDVGNDIQTYGSRLYAVINCSNKVEVMDAATCRRIGQIDIPNCRYIVFDGPYAYVSSYAGPVEINPDYEQKGFVAKVDTATMQVTGRCLVGFQPDGMAIHDGKLYVANSGGYMVPNYERTVSVISLDTFTPERNLDIDINLHYVIADAHNHLWVASRGDYYGTAPAVYCYDLAQDKVIKKIDTCISNYWLHGDSIYSVGQSFSYEDFSQIHSYDIINTATCERVSTQYINDATKAKIQVPYGVAVNPVTRDIYIGDAGNMVNPGTLYCFASDGSDRWNVRTGDIPAHFAFLTKTTKVKL